MANLRTANTRRRRNAVKHIVRENIDALVARIIAENPAIYGTSVNSVFTEYAGDPDEIPKGERWVQHKHANGFMSVIKRDDTWLV